MAKGWGGRAVTPPGLEKVQHSCWLETSERASDDVTIIINIIFADIIIYGG